MALSKSTRIMLLLAIDSAFFLLELVTGYAVHSLALVADAFHMLNDVLSLCVGLWAVKVAHQKPSSQRYTYGWQRAETLGALVNGIFLVALCLSIFLEAIQRFVEPQTVSNPVLILIVGSCGLVSNVLGLFLFHDHGHSHGSGEGHENGHSHATTATGHGDTAEIANEGGAVSAVLPETVVNIDGPAAGTLDKAAGNGSPIHRHTSNSQRRSSNARRRFTSADDINFHPASFRNNVIAQSRPEWDESTDDTDQEDENGRSINKLDATETSPLLEQPREHTPKMGNLPGFRRHRSHGSWHANHRHAQPRSPGKEKNGHSHSDLNMKGVFLHVLGDALGNIGVIASALFIWLTPFSWRFYSDPFISLVITGIILLSAIPLCKAASRILLQAVPAGVSVEDIKEDIRQLPGIENCHHLHVWQLSDTKLVASLHVEVSFDFEGEGAARYMELAQVIRECLHAHGIHSSTIQPEFSLRSKSSHRSLETDATMRDATEEAESSRGSKKPSRSGSPPGDEAACLLDCGDECDAQGQCCTPVIKDNEQ